ncbi:MAG TPA: heparinase II/III family protein [Rectinemataceae bacterium]|nr:heparinase II/III family protein [Rectinemataceae bacterium]
MESKVNRNIFKNALIIGGEARNPAIVRDILSTPSLCSYLEEIAGKTAEYRATPIPNLPFGLFRLFDETGDRLGFEAPYFERRRRLVATGLAAWLWKKPEDIASLEDLIWAICDEYTWALPAHLEGGSLDSRALPDRDALLREAVWPHNAFLDLFSCETGFALAELVTILEGSLTPIVANRAAGEVRSRVIAPFLARKEPWRWELMRNNWCAVCAGSVGAAALYLERDGDRLATIISRVLPTMDRFLSSFADDGACLEGSGYWTYGVGFFVSFAEMLEKATGGSLNLMAGERFKRIAAFQRYCYLNDSLALSFADGSSRERFRRGITHYLAQKFPDLPAPDASLAASFAHDFYGRCCLSFRDLLWTRGTAKEGGSRASAEPVWLPDAQWLVCPARHMGSLAFAAKGGRNDEPHNHNDIGSFELVWGDREFLADLGCGEYTREYFGEGRYSIFCNSSFGHSLPIIDGRGQSPGAAHKAKNPEFRRDGAYITLRMDIADAYDCGELVSLVRIFQFDGGSCLSVRDEFRFSRPGIQIVERFVTRSAEFLRVKANPGEAVQKPFGNPARDASPSASSLSISCSVDGIVPKILLHDHREHDGRNNRVTSLDYGFRPQTADFTVSFEFRLQGLEKTSA